MIEQFTVTLPRLTGEEERRAYVYLPQAALEDEEARFPVLYMFDGHNVFFDDHATYGKSWGMAEFLDYTEIPLIVAAVECNHSPDNGRLSEYSPYDFKSRQFGAVQGRGEETMDWLVHCFKPYVDENFPTLPQREFTFLAGSSMGGLMTLYGLVAYNHVFSRGAALSPSVWVSPRKLEELISTADLEETTLYMDYGSHELGNHGAMRQRLCRVAQKLLERGVYVDFRIVPRGDHSEASWERQIPFFMETLLYDLD